MAAKDTAQSVPTGVVVAVVVVVLVIVVGIGMRMFGGSSPRNAAEEFAPDMKVLAAQTPPGYTPYGQPPRPGEVRPPYRAGMGEASR